MKLIKKILKKILKKMYDMAINNILITGIRKEKITEEESLELLKYIDESVD